jgi:hypothetical protein
VVERLAQGGERSLAGLRLAPMPVS